MKQSNFLEASTLPLLPDNTNGPKILRGKTAGRAWQFVCRGAVRLAMAAPATHSMLRGCLQTRWTPEACNRTQQGGVAVGGTRATSRNYFDAEACMMVSSSCMSAWVSWPSRFCRMMRCVACLRPSLRIVCTSSSCCTQGTHPAMGFRPQATDAIAWAPQPAGANAAMVAATS